MFVPAINPPQGAGCGFGPPWCHRRSHQLLGMGGDSRAAAQRVWGSARVPQNQSTPKPEQATPCPCSLWCHPGVISTLLGAGGPGPVWLWAGVAMGLVPAREPLCLEQGAQRAGASATSGPPSSSRCNGHSAVRPCSDVPVPHSPAGAPAGARVPPLGVLRTGFGLSPFGKG